MRQNVCQAYQWTFESLAVLLWDSLWPSDESGHYEKNLTENDDRSIWIY